MKTRNTLLLVMFSVLVLLLNPQAQANQCPVDASISYKLSHPECGVLTASAESEECVAAQKQFKKYKNIKANCKNNKCKHVSKVNNKTFYIKEAAVLKKYNQYLIKFREACQSAN